MVKPLQEFTGAFYAKVAVLCFGVGAGIETFMVNTGFYDMCAGRSPPALTLLLEEIAATGRPCTGRNSVRRCVRTARSEPPNAQPCPEAKP